MESIDEKFEGQIELHKEVLKVIPLIVKHFEGYNGRAATGSGRSAYFDKVVQKFYFDCKLLAPRIYIDDAYRHAVYVSIDINLPAHNGSHVNYFKIQLHIGRVNNEHFEYDFSECEEIKSCNAVISTKLEDLNEQRANIKSLLKKAADIKHAVPSAFTDIIEAR